MKPTSEFTATSRRELHQIGFPDAPILELLEAPSPDDAIEIERLAGRVIGPASVALDAAVEGWVPPHAREDVAAIVQHLPPGDYWIVRSRKKLGDPGGILQGNELLPVDRSLRELHNSGRYYVLVVGMTAGHDPDLNRPLLGVTILNYTGQGTTQAVWLLQAIATREEGLDVEIDEALFIVPASGSLVLDHLEGFSAASSARCRKQWADRGARTLARELAAGLAHRDRT